MLDTIETVKKPFFKPDIFQNRTDRGRFKFAPLPGDILVQCPGCKTLETVQVYRGQLFRSRRFFQKNGAIFHDCGSLSPCSLFKT